MKWILSALLAALMLLGVGAFAEEMDLGLARVAENVEASLDLDGDGVMETLIWHSEALDAYDEQAVVRIFDGNGQKTIWTSGMLYAVEVHVQDIDGDGMMEIFVSGDEMSADYITFCMHWQDGVINMMSFPDVSRGENVDARHGFSYGMVTGLGENWVELTGAQDAVGTYFGYRRAAIVNGQFEICDDGYWVFEWDFSDPEVWEYAALVVAKPLTVVLEDGARVVLEPGAKLLITHSDKVSFAGFALQDGRRGCFEIAPDVAQGFGSLVNGVPESEVFEFVPYAG